MKYKITKGKRKAIASYGKYVARAVHPQTLDSEAFFEEVAREAGTAKPSDVHAVMGKVMSILVKHLQQGDNVDIPYLGRLKMELDCAPVDRLEDFDPSKHIIGAHINFTPLKKDHERVLLDGVEFEEMKV